MADKAHAQTISAQGLADVVASTATRVVREAHAPEVRRIIIRPVLVEVVYFNRRLATPACVVITLENRATQPLPCARARVLRTGVLLVVAAPAVSLVFPSVYVPAAVAAVLQHPA